jgi:hypothetical protein
MHINTFQMGFFLEFEKKKRASIRFINEAFLFFFFPREDV